MDSPSMRSRRSTSRGMRSMMRMVTRSGWTTMAPRSSRMYGALYEEVIGRRGAVPTLIERDANLPPFEELLAEAHRADRVAREVREVRNTAAAGSA